jgi:hypothetical protein
MQPTIFERSTSLGGLWGSASTTAYSSLRANTSNLTLRFSGADRLVASCLLVLVVACTVLRKQTQYERALAASCSED